MKKHLYRISGILFLILIIIGSTSCGSSSNQYMEDVSLSAEHAWTGDTPDDITKTVTITITPSAAIEDEGSLLTITPAVTPGTDIDEDNIQNPAGAGQGDSVDGDLSFPSPTATVFPSDSSDNALTVTPSQSPSDAATDANTNDSDITPTIPSDNSQAADAADSSSDSQLPAFSGVSYVVMDPVTGEIMMSSDADKQIYPASTIKLLTALTALDYLDMDEVITADQSVLDQVEWDAAQYGVVAGTTYTLEVWMHLLLISSYGDAADVIANAAGGSISGFVDKMNEKAKELGLTNTKVDNAIGLDIGNDYEQMHSTATDIAKLAAAAMKNQAICEIVKKAKYTVPACDAMASREIESTNWYLTKSDTYCSDYFKAIGTKSGSTDAAGSCYVATVINDEGKKYICAYFGGTSKDVVFREMTTFLEYTYKYLT